MHGASCKQNKGIRKSNSQIRSPETSFFNSGKCTLCYQCRKICPAGAVYAAVEGGNTPMFDYKRCIRCFCCMEICTYDAIILRRGLLQWMLRQ